MEELEAFVSKSFAGQDLTPTEPSEEQKRAAVSIRKCTEWLSLIQGTTNTTTNSKKGKIPSSTPKNKMRPENCRPEKEPLDGAAKTEDDVEERENKERKRTMEKDNEEQLVKRLKEADGKDYSLHF